MTSPANEDMENTAFVPLTKAERIQQLNAIDKSISQLLRTAGQTLKTLSASQSSTDPSIADRKAAFQEATDSYLKTLHSVDIGLGRQIWGLEEAGIIPAEKGKKVVEESQSKFAMPGQKPKNDTAAESNIGENGMGKLDIGFLNSRSGRVGRDMEAELWERSRKFLEGLEKEKSDGNSEKEDEIMGT